MLFAYKMPTSGSHSLVDINLACFVVCPGWPLHITLHHAGLFSPFTSLDVISHSLAAGYLVLLRS